jgi:recombination protein RecT
MINTMENTSVTTTEKKPLTLKGLFEREDMKKRFNEILGQKSGSFVASVLQLSAADNKLSQCEPMSVMGSALIAATLDLPVNKNLGFSWIISYGNQAQFQIGYKGFIQLAMRTGQYERLNVIEIYENQFKSFDSLTEELDADTTITGTGKVVGYACYFRLINGFEKTTYWTTEKVLKHAQRFSKTFNSGPWKTDFDAMAKKTVIKNTLSAWGILSTTMVMAQQSDQAVITETESGEPDYQYPDNEPARDELPKADPIIEKINSFSTFENLAKYKINSKGDEKWTPEQKEAYQIRSIELGGQ